MKRVLNLYMFEKSGHHLAAMATEEAMWDLDEDWKILTMDSLGYTNPYLNQLIQKSYLSMLGATPGMWSYLYDSQRVANKIDGFKEFVNRTHSNKLEELLDFFAPQVVVCTQAFPCGVVSSYKNSRKKKTPLLIGVVTDYLAHNYWFYEEVDFYAVPHEVTRNDLIKRGVPREKIRITGIPVHPKFLKKQNKQKLAERLNIDPELPTLLIMGGGQGLGPLEEVVAELDALPFAFQMIVVTGLNKALKEKLKRRKGKRRRRGIRGGKKPSLILGYAENIEELMEVADIIITKPGGMTIAEALVKRLGIIISNVLPGQEEKNTQFLLDKRAVLQASGKKEISVIVKELLENPKRLEALRAEAGKLARPRAARKIAEMVRDIVDGETR